MKPVCHRRHAQRGVALIFVLGLIALLAVLTTLLVSSLRIRLLEQARRESSAELRQAAYSVLAAQIAAIREYRIAGGSICRTTQSWATLGTDTRELERELGITARCTVTDESAKLPLNTADIPLLTRLFVSLDIPQTEAEQLAAALADWTDEDDTLRNNGAESESYSLDEAPNNATVKEPSELIKIRGFDRWFGNDDPAKSTRLKRLMEMTSLFADNPRPNINEAPEPVIAFIAQDTGETAQHVISVRDTTGRNHFKNAMDMTTRGIAAALAMRVNCTASIVRLETHVARGDISLGLRAIIRIDADGITPVQVSETRGESE